MLQSGKGRLVFRPNEGHLTDLHVGLGKADELCPFFRDGHPGHNDINFPFDKGGDELRPRHFHEGDVFVELFPKLVGKVDFDADQLAKHWPAPDVTVQAVDKIVDTAAMKNLIGLALCASGEKAASNAFPADVAAAV